MPVAPYRIDLFLLAFLPLSDFVERRRALSPNDTDANSKLKRAQEPRNRLR